MSKYIVKVGLVREEEVFAPNEAEAQLEAEHLASQYMAISRVDGEPADDFIPCGSVISCRGGT